MQLKLAIILLSALTSLTQGALSPRIAPSCDGFPDAIVSDTLMNFQLVAIPFDSTRPSVGLHINPVAAIVGIGWNILSAGAGGLTMNLTQGFLKPFHPEVPVLPFPQQSSASVAVVPGTSPVFVDQRNVFNPAAVYCAVAPDTATNPFLALNGATTEFSLCANHTGTANGRVDLVYDAPASTCGSCLSDCFQVSVQIVPN